MPDPKEPENYSIDEMMGRLKNRSSEDPIESGELVTRADGSRAIRVRSKKRRSRQPHKEQRLTQRRSRMIQVSAALILILLVLFAAGFALAFANSTPFREKLVQNITLCSGARADLQQFRMNPTSANASMLDLEWPSGNMLETLKLRGLKAEISPISFFGKSMVGEEASAAEGTLTLRLPDADEPWSELPVGNAPDPIRFNQFSIARFNLIMSGGSGSKASGIRMADSEATLITRYAAERNQLLLNRGDITISGWPKLRMERSHIEFRGSELDVIGMRVRHETDSRGIMELSGTVAPYAADRASTLELQLQSFLVSGIAGAELGRLFSGRIDTVSAATPNSLSFIPGPEPACSLTAHFNNSLSSTFEIAGFPFLFGLSQTLNDEWFGHPVFDNEIRGTLRRTAGNVIIENLNLESRGRMALRGTVTMAPDRKLSGKLEIGVTEGMIKTADNPRLAAMFSPLRDQFRWLTLKIGGTASSPTDNFKDLYDSAESAQPSAPSADAPPSFEDLTRPE